MLVFCVFVILAAILWLSKALSEEEQRDIRCNISVVGCPDSVTRVSAIPEAMIVSVRAPGSQLLFKDSWNVPEIKIDYRHYLRNGIISLGQPELRALARHALGQGCQVLAVNPDTLLLRFTSRPPVRLPVVVDANVTTMPNCALTGPVTTTTDSVWVYSLNPFPENIRVIYTQPVRLKDVAESTRLRVPLQAPPGCRAIPDSVDIRVNVEPMISRTATVPVRTVNVPAGYKLILIPSTVNVNYTMPMSRYSDSRPKFTVTADFATLDRSFSNNRIAVRLTYAKGNFLNVYLPTDSVEYIIEKK